MFFSCRNDTHAESFLLNGINSKDKGKNSRKRLDQIDADEFADIDNSGDRRRLQRQRSETGVSSEFAGGIGALSHA